MVLVRLLVVSLVVMVLFSAVGWSGFGMLGNAGAQFAGFLYLFHGVGQVVPKQNFCDGNFVRTQPRVALLKWWPNARPSKEGQLMWGVCEQSHRIAAPSCNFMSPLPALTSPSFSISLYSPLVLRGQYSLSDGAISPSFLSLFQPTWSLEIYCWQDLPMTRLLVGPWFLGHGGLCLVRLED